MTSDGHSVDFFPLRYTPKDLAGVPEEEVVFFLLCGQLHNDVAVLMRQVLQARVAGGRDAEPEAIAASIAGSLNVRLLCGRLDEAWALIGRRFQKIFAGLGDEVDPGARDDLAALGRYFSGPNLVRKVRNKLSAHIDRNLVSAAYRRFDPAEPLTDFHAMIEGNTLFFSGEALMLLAIQELADESSAHAAFARLTDEVLQVGRRTSNVVWTYIQAFSVRHLRSAMEALGSERIIVANLPPIEGFRAPLFLVPPEKEARD